MSSITDILGSLIQSGMSKSSGKRVKKTLEAGSPIDLNSIADIFGQKGGAFTDIIRSTMTKTSSGRAGGLGSVLADALGDAGRSLGSGNKLAVGGLGALIGSVLGGGKGSAKGAVGGGVMAMLAALAFSALKKGGSAPKKAPLGLLEQLTPEEQQVVEREADLAIKAMVNAAKADGHIDAKEIDRIMGKLGEDGVDEEERRMLTEEMEKPFDPNFPSQPVEIDQQVAAQIYVASLFAIEVDRDAERQYLHHLAERLNLSATTVRHIEDTIGI